MNIPANNPALKSWIPVSTHSDFPIQNIPFGAFSTDDDEVVLATRIGDFAISLPALNDLGYFKDINFDDSVLYDETLNAFISEGKSVWRAIRNRISEIFEENNSSLRDNEEHKKLILFPLENVQVELPIYIGDYTDFYSSREHATNVGKMFRDPENALLPNWLHLPVGYHGRSSTVIPSGMPVNRPLGQTLPKGEKQPIFGESKRVDFELETAFITSDANIMGDRVSVNDAENHIFGMVLLNDWSARDLQTWEYVPLGPFLAKNFGTSISCWIVTLDALEPFRCESPKQEDPKPLPYLQQTGNHAFDINLEVELKPKNSEGLVVCKSNFKYLYWTMAQQLAHHTVNGCMVTSGDLMGSGTISGPTPDSYGSLLEITWAGQNPIQMPDGSTRTFIEDYDTIIMKGYCEKDGVRIGFGEVSSQLLPAIPFE